MTKALLDEPTLDDRSIQAAEEAYDNFVREAGTRSPYLNTRAFRLAFDAALRSSAPQEPVVDVGLVEQIARSALFGVELARTHLVQPVNGSHDYFYVTFAGAQIEFKLPYGNDPEVLRGPLGPEMAELSEKAGKCATAINDLLFDLAKKSARSTLDRLQAKAPEIGEE